MSKKREEYVVDRLESLLDLIEGVYETSDDFLIAEEQLVGGDPDIRSSASN